MKNMQWPRIRRKNVLRGIIAVGIGISLYVIFNKKEYNAYINNESVKCKHSKAEEQELIQLAYDVHSVLAELQLDHWLMYGSVYGALRYEKPLPWDYDVDIGIRAEQFNPFIKERIFKMLAKRGIGIYDKIRFKGVIVCSRSKSMVDVFLFTEYNDGWMKRQGWHTWLFFLHYSYWHSFPAELVRAPMPMSKFGFFNISIPRGGVEITRHLYRNDWWKIVKPNKCR